MQTETTYPMAEAAVRERTGLSRTTLKQIREKNLREGEHFEHVGHEIRFSAAGLQAVAALIGSSQTALGADYGKEDAGEAMAKPDAGPRAAAAPVTVLVGMICPNPTWIKVRLPSGEVVPVRVSNNRRMQHGTPIKVIQVDGVWCHDMGPRRI